MISGQTKERPKLASKKKCTGCMACVDICPKRAISQFIDEDGHTYVKIDKSLCIGCKQCENVCKLSRSYYGNNNLKETEIYAGWTNDKNDRKKSTSGGIFAALAKQVISEGGVVIGACLDGRECKHVLIKKIEDIPKLQGSKYMVSSTLGIYKAIEKEIKEHIVLFSGVGCQCAGIKAYFEGNKYNNNLIVVDIVCGGFPSKILLDKFYEQYPEIEAIASFREKDKYILKAYNKNGYLYSIDKKSLPLHGFNCELTNRYSCYNCKFAKAHRKTDITLGDLWNYNYLNKEHKKGISTILVHSKKGKDLLKKAYVSIERINWGDCIDYCKRVVWGITPVFLPRIHLKRNAKKMDNILFTKLYCMDINPQNPFLFSFRVFRYIIMHINNLIAKIYIMGLKKIYSNKGEDNEKNKD